MGYHPGMTTNGYEIRKRSGPRRWVEPQRPSGIASALHPHPLLELLLAQRGVLSAEDADRFLDSQSVAYPDPSLLPDIDAAVDRITGAILAGERIGIFGDYDVDGVTSVATLQLALQRVADDPANIIPRLPTRAEGYGLNETALRQFAGQGVTLMVALDCGSTDDSGVALAQSLGMDVIIVDHHHMNTTGPTGAITISPARPDGGRYRELSASGLTWTLVNALQSSPQLARRGLGGIHLELIDLAALGIVADVSSMLGATRVMVREGLRLMRFRPRTGIRALCETAGVDWRSLSTYHLGYVIGPRLNAAGRLGDPLPALQLLTTGDRSKAEVIAGQLETMNQERRRETDLVVNTVLERLQSKPAAGAVIVESDPAWSSGIVGLAAGKVVELVGRPVILLAENGDVATGSARSVTGFNVVEALSRQRSLLSRHGGHSQAAGLTMPTSQIRALAEALHNDAESSGIQLPIDRDLHLSADIEARDLTMDVARMVTRLSPFGVDNPEPVLRLRNVPVVRTETMGKDGSHLRVVFRGPSGEIRAPFFSAAYRAQECRGRRMDLAFTMSISHWNGPRLDLKIEDFREAQP